MGENVANYLTPQNEKKFNRIQKSLCQISNVYDDVSKKTIRRLRPSGSVPWRFFEHPESGKLFAENINEKDCFTWPALHRAARWNLLKIAQALIEAEVNINVTDKFGCTALHIAASSRNGLKIGKMLIDSGADVNAKDIDQRTPMDFANLFGRTEFIKMLSKI